MPTIDQYLDFFKTALLVVGPLSGVWLASHLDFKKNRKEFLRSEKKEAYAQVQVGLATDFLMDEQNVDAVKDEQFERKMRLRMAKLFSTARLLAPVELANKLRTYFTLRSKALDCLKTNQDDSDLLAQMGVLGRDIENMMREDLIV